MVLQDDVSLSEIRRFVVMRSNEGKSVRRPFKLSFFEQNSEDQRWYWRLESAV